MLESKLRIEALRINRRYLTEVVEAFDLCPWARTVSDGSGLERRVMVGARDTPALRDSVSVVIEEMADRTDVAITLLIFPRLDVTEREFRTFVASMEASHAESHARGALPLAMASFHPQAEADLSSAAKLVPFIRRAPDPTIQLVRREAIAKVSRNETGSVFAENLDSFLPMLGDTPKASTSDTIAQNNLSMITRVGAETIEAILQDIADDRLAAYGPSRSDSSSD